MQMESLREECAVLKRELESLRQVTAAKASPRNNQEREETEVEDSITEWSKKLEEMSTQHLAVSSPPVPAPEAAPLLIVASGAEHHAAKI
jgi:hypothetical protein